LKGDKARAFLRFTPTGVGTMILLVLVGLILTVHPHGCGDNEALGGDPTPRERFTPTGVGTMTCYSTLDVEYAVHPHGRGDNSS